MPIFDIDPQTDPKAPGVLKFYEQGKDPSTGWQVNSAGQVLGNVTFTGGPDYSGAAPTFLTSTAGASAIQVTVGGDTEHRFVIDGDGRLEWGDGTNARDARIYREGPAALRTDGKFTIGSIFFHAGSLVGFYGAAPTNQPTVSGSRADGTALASLLTALATLGLITDSTTA